MVVCTGAWDGMVQVWDLSPDMEPEPAQQQGTAASKQGGGGRKRSRPTGGPDAAEDAYEAPVPVFQLRGHSQAVSAVAWRRNAGDQLLSGSWDHSVRLWDVHAGMPARTMKCGKVVTSLSQSASGAAVVTGHHDNAVRLWDVHAGMPA